MENEIWGTVQSAGKITYPTQLGCFCKPQEHSHAGDEPHGEKVILTGNITSQGVTGYAQVGFCAVESKHIFSGCIMDPLLWSFCNNYPLLQQYNNWHFFAIMWMLMFIILQRSHTWKIWLYYFSFYKIFVRSSHWLLIDKYFYAFV